MRRELVFLGIIFLLISTCVPSDSSKNHDFQIYGNHFVAQSFTPSLGNISTMQLRLKKIGNPPNDLNISIYDSLAQRPILTMYRHPTELLTSYRWETFSVGKNDFYEGGTIWDKYLGSIKSDFLFKTYDATGRVDQQWTKKDNEWFTIYGEDTYFAQSFKPSTDTLSKVALYIEKGLSPSDLIVSILDSLKGNVLVTVAVPPDKIPASGWCEIPLGNHTVVQDHTYYIVCRTLTTSSGFYNLYCSLDANGTNSYTRGEPWKSFYSGVYYIVCQTTGGNSNNYYSWEIDNETSYQMGSCLISNDSGESWHEHPGTVMSYYFTVKKSPIQPDQHQFNFSDSGAICNKTHGLAQSFIPTHDILSKIRLLLFSSYHMTSDITVSVRQHLNGTDLASASISPENFSSINGGNLFWYEFNLHNVTLDAGSVYYLVLHSSDSIGGYCWGFNGFNPYKNGTAYRSFDGGKTWNVDTETHTPDYCFETFYVPSPPTVKIFSQRNSLFIFKEKYPDVDSLINVGRMKIRLIDSIESPRIIKVTGFVDNKLVFTLTTGPYVVHWNDYALSSGWHQLRIETRMDSGSSIKSEMVFFKFT